MRAVSTIEDFARELLTWVCFRRQGRANTPLIFICHSLGGIVVKKVKLLDNIYPAYEIRLLN